MALEVGVLGIVIVFMILALLIILIRVQGIFLNSLEKRRDNVRTDQVEQVEAVKQTQIEMHQNDSSSEAGDITPREVAIITAAISAYLGTSLRIHSIRPLPQNIAKNDTMTSWKLQSRLEQNY